VRYVEAQQAFKVATETVDGFWVSGPTQKLKTAVNAALAWRAFNGWFMSQLTSMPYWQGIGQQINRSAASLQQVFDGQRISLARPIGATCLD